MFPVANVKSSPPAQSESRDQIRRRCLLYATLALILGFCWETTLVYTLYGGNWTSLFYHRQDSRLPEEPAFANTYKFPDELGYDGQYYRIIAHDPFLNRGSVRYLDSASFRARRILVPLLAW